MNKFTLLSLIVVLAAIAAGLAFPSDASANNAWGNYHWARTSNPFTLKLGDNVNSTWQTYFEMASADWTKSNVLNTNIVSGGTGRRRCRPTNGSVEVCNYAYGQNGWLGLAQIWISGSHITQGVVKVNDTYFNMAAYNNINERQHVMCQEIGHTLGLDHQDESGASLNTCMDYYYNTSNSDTKSTHPNQHDYDQLAAIYAHLDSTTTLRSVPEQMQNADLEARSAWGREIRASANKRAAIFERDFGGGHKVFTFVIWVQ
ncbi:MAG: hypothetical protein HY782_03105 [Chloroflexi bacterium]|nr:hypothetical protein [Chloroflexota bacterium]